MFEIVIVSFITGFSLYLFLTEKFRVDFVALIILSLLIIFNLVTPEESVSGFSNAATITIAAMFILSRALNIVGVVNGLGKLLLKFSKNQNILVLVIIIFTGFISSFINNTAAVAVLMPTILTVSKRKKFANSRLLIPLSYAAQFGGVCTLIGTSTNLLVSSLYASNGYREFSMFEFTQLGLILFFAGTVYFLLFGKYVLPNYKDNNLEDSYNLGKFITELRVTEKSILIGKSLFESNLGKNFDISVLEVFRQKEALLAFPNTVLCEGDVLLISCDFEDLITIQEEFQLESQANYKFLPAKLKDHKQILLEAIVAPNSKMIGRELKSLNFSNNYNAIIVAIRRRNTILNHKLKHHKFSIGDELLLLVSKENLEFVENNPDLIVLRHRKDAIVDKKKMFLALAILLFVILMPVLGIMPILQSSIIGCVLMILSNCIGIEESYRAIDWKIIILLAGILPLGIALEKSGLTAVIATQSLELFSQFGPEIFIGVLYFVTVILTSLISNNATAVLMTPIAISIAKSLDVSPEPLVIAVCFAASTSFATPIGYQTNTMVYSAGNYKFRDFIRAGVPLNFIFLVIAVIFIPIFWRF